MAYNECMVHGENVETMCAKCHEELEAERDRLREIVAKRGEATLALAAECAGLRGAHRFLWEQVLQMQATHPYPCSLADDIAAMEKRISPLTAAVQRVLGAVGKWYLADAALIAADGTQGFFDALAAMESGGQKLADAHDSLQALLRGEGESP